MVCDRSGLVWIYFRMLKEKRLKFVYGKVLCLNENIPRDEKDGGRWSLSDEGIKLSVSVLR